MLVWIVLSSAQFSMTASVSRLQEIIKIWAYFDCSHQCVKSLWFVCFRRKMNTDSCMTSRDAYSQDVLRWPCQAYATPYLICMSSNMLPILFHTRNYVEYDYLIYICIRWFMHDWINLSLELTLLLYVFILPLSFICGNVFILCGFNFLVVYAWWGWVFIVDVLTENEWLSTMKSDFNQTLPLDTIKDWLVIQIPCTW